MVTVKGDVVGKMVVFKPLNWNWDCDTWKNDKNRKERKRKTFLCLVFHLMDMVVVEIETIFMISDMKVLGKTRQVLNADFLSF